MGMDEWRGLSERSTRRYFYKNDKMVGTRDAIGRCVVHQRTTTAASRLRATVLIVTQRKIADHQHRRYLPVGDDDPLPTVKPTYNFLHCHTASKSQTWHDFERVSRRVKGFETYHKLEWTCFPTHVGRIYAIESVMSTHWILQWLWMVLGCNRQTPVGIPRRWTGERGNLW